MKNKILPGFIFIIVALAIAGLFKKPKAFVAHKKTEQIVISNKSDSYYPDVSVKLTANKKTYRSNYKFIPSKGSVVLKPSDFSNEQGDTLQDIEIVNNLEISGGDSLINETVDEEIDLR